MEITELSEVGDGEMSWRELKRPLDPIAFE